MEALLIQHIRILGGLLIVLALLHLIFPTYFNWKKDLKSLSLSNRQMMIVHTFFIALIVFLMGLLFVYAAPDIVNSQLGKTMSLGIAIFWTCRLVIQFFGYSSELWRNKVFETYAHVGFSFLWIYLSVVFWCNWLYLL